jgi:hypothetical protein
MKHITTQWVIDKVKDLHVEDDLIEILGREIQQEIDNEIMLDYYSQSLWVQIKLPRFNDRKHAVDIQRWCDENIDEHEYANFGSTFVFKNGKDAEWFALKWMNT